MVRLLKRDEGDWQNVLRANLQRKNEVDLTHVNIEFDREYLKLLAQQTGMLFTYDEGTHAASFRKEKLNR